MDTHAFASLAQVRILLVPVGTIPQSSFNKYAAELRTFDAIRLGDIPADNKDERGICISYSFVMHPFMRNPSPVYAKPDVDRILAPQLSDSSSTILSLAAVAPPALQLPTCCYWFSSMLQNRLLTVYPRGIQYRLT